MKKLFSIIWISFIGIAGVQAQLMLPQALQKPIESALARDVEIGNKELDLQKTALERKSVIGMLIPSLDALAGYAYFDNHITVDLPGYKLPVTGAELFTGKTTMDNHANAAHAGLLAKSVLYSGGQIRNGARALEEKRKGDSLLIETDRDNIIVDVVGSFDKLKFIDASEKLIEDSDRRLQKEEERVNAAIANGLAVPFDREKIKLARLELEARRAELSESKDLLLKKLNYLTGMSRAELEGVAYEPQTIILQDELTADNKQELEALGAYRKAAGLVLKKERGTLLPRVAAFAGVSYTGLFNGSSSFYLPDLPAALQQPKVHLNQFSVAPNWMAGVVLKWNIFNGNQRKNKITQAELSAKQLDNKLNDTKEKLNLLLSQKTATYQTRLKQMSIADQQVTVSQNNLVLAQKQYAQGLISITERLAAENDFVKAGQVQTGAIINQRQAALEALQVTGKLSEKITYQ